MSLFRYVKYSLVFILAFVGVKMLLMQVYHVPNAVSLAVIVLALLTGVLASVVHKDDASPAAGGDGSAR
jgi:tellurite resistance protein TerC